MNWIKVVGGLMFLGEIPSQKFLHKTQTEHIFAKASTRCSQPNECSSYFPFFPLPKRITREFQGKLDRKRRFSMDEKGMKSARSIPYTIGFGHYEVSPLYSEFELFHPQLNSSKTSFRQGNVVRFGIKSVHVIIQIKIKHIG